MKRVKQSPCRSISGAEGSRRLRAPRFQDNRHMKVVRLSAKDIHLVLIAVEAESTPGL